MRIFFYWWGCGSEGKNGLLWLLEMGVNSFMLNTLNYMQERFVGVVIIRGCQRENYVSTGGGGILSGFNCQHKT